MVSDIGEKLLEAAAEARLATRPQSARAVVKSVMPYLARLRVGGYSWGEIAAAAGKAALVKPDGSAFTAKVLAEYFGSLGGAALVQTEREGGTVVASAPTNKAMGAAQISTAPSAPTAYPLSSKRSLPAPSLTPSEHAAVPSNTTMSTRKAAIIEGRGDATGKFMEILGVNSSE